MHAAQHQLQPSSSCSSSCSLGLASAALPGRNTVGGNMPILKCGRNYLVVTGAKISLGYASRSLCEQSRKPTFSALLRTPVVIYTRCIIYT